MLDIMFNNEITQIVQYILRGRWWEGVNLGGRITPVVYHRAPFKDRTQ